MGLLVPANTFVTIIRFYFAHDDLIVDAKVEISNKTVVLMTTEMMLTARNSYGTIEI